jgi:predicted aldo/keto reductase-like oxidoreductase
MKEHEPMQTIRLGKTNLQVSRIGIGGIPIQRPSFEDAIKVIQCALDLGISFIDTARGYGASEERIGKAIAGRRDHVILATKTGGRTAAEALEHLEESLRQLATDYIDLWQFHNVSTFEAYEQVLGPGGAMETAQRALKAGKIQHIGLSSHHLEVARKAVSSSLFETIQFPFNFVNYEPASELLPLIRERSMGFIAMKPFAGGRLSNANLAIKYLLQFEEVVPDPGVERVEEVEELVGIVNRGSWELTPQDWQEIESIRSGLGTRFCQWCGYCQPCPQEVNVPYLMNIRGMWRLWPAEKFFPLLGEMVEGARNCIECGECETKCPYHLPIREQIVEGIKFYESLRP